MTREEAIQIRSAQLKGEPVRAILLQEAIEVIQRTGSQKGRPQKFRLAKLTPLEREQMNASLLFNLGLAIGAARAQA